MIEQNFLELVEIESVVKTDEYVNMVDISIDDNDASFTLSNGIISHNSARTLAIAGFSQTGRDYYGAFPLKGKPLNVRDTTLAKIKNNDEIKNIIQILGLEFGRKYRDLKSLRYGKVVIMSDADCLCEDTLILTLNGNKKIKDLTYYDKVLTHTNEYKSIKKIIETEKEEYVNVSFNGENIKVGTEHIMLVYRDGIVKEIAAKDLIPSDFLLRKKK